MTDRPILRLPDPQPVRRLKGSSGFVPPPKGPGRDQQVNRFGQQFTRIEAALELPDPAIELRRDPFGIAPERALVFVTKGPINNFVRAAGRIGLEVLSESELGDDYELPDDLTTQNKDSVKPTLYATMPTLDTFHQFLRLWRKYQAKLNAEPGYAPWWHLFDLLAELRAWGPNDRLTTENCLELENRLPFDDDKEVRVEIEHWPTKSKDLREQGRQSTEARIKEMGGRIIDRSSIHEGSFHYDALLVGLSAGVVREMIQKPSALGGIAVLDGIQFVLPQTIAQSLPSQPHPIDANINNLERFETDGAFRVLLLDGTPIAGHPALDGGIAIEDVHDLVRRSVGSTRYHATEMASLILRGDLLADGQPLVDSRVLAIPVLIDTDGVAISPDDRLFVDLVHVTLQRVFGGDTPLAPDVFVVNFSIGVHHSHFAGRISSLARLLDWWSTKAGVLFVVSAGNIDGDLEIRDITLGNFESIPVSERQSFVRAAQRRQRHERTLLSPSEALNVLTIGAASLDPAPSATNLTPRTVEICQPGEILPAISTGTGLGPFRCIKPDLIATGGHHEVKALPRGDALKLRLVRQTMRTGLTVARVSKGRSTHSRARGTSCATALVTRFLSNAAVALTEEDGPYNGYKLSRIDLALLTRALAVNGARWPEAVKTFYETERTRLNGRYQQATEEVVRYFGHGFLNSELMSESPLRGATLVGLGQIKKDQGAIFDMPLPSSLSGDTIGRSMQVTLAWFSPVEPTRARYRLAALEAIAADDSVEKSSEKDDEWGLSMKSAPPNRNLISRGTVWSQRFVHKRKRVTPFADDATLPIRVQCRDTSGGGLNPDEQIHFAIVVTLQLEGTVQYTIQEYDIHEEIRNRLLIRIPAQ